jgi:LacI family transcriptional regulator
MSVTQKQIAEYVGFSQPIVGRALKGDTQISAKTRGLIVEAAKELGYGAHSNGAARALRARRGGDTTRTYTIGVIIGDAFEGAPLYMVPFFQPLFKGMEAEAEARGLDVWFFSLHLHRMPRLLIEGGLDGAISLYNGPAEVLLRQHQLLCPVLLVGDGAVGERVLRPDDQQGIYLATRHLIGLGHQRIAYLGDLVESVPDVAYKNRLEGYLQAIQESGLPVYQELMETHVGGVEHEAGARGITRILERTRDFTALVCFNDIPALGAMGELKRRGIRLPEDVSVTGFDDVWESYPEEPPLTTVYFDRFEMGRRAVEIICEAGEAKKAGVGAGREYSLSGHELLPVRLVERASTAPPRTV